MDTGRLLAVPFNCEVSSGCRCNVSPSRPSEDRCQAAATMTLKPHADAAGTGTGNEHNHSGRNSAARRHVASTPKLPPPLRFLASLRWLLVLLTWTLTATGPRAAWGHMVHPAVPTDPSATRQCWLADVATKREDGRLDVDDAVTMTCKSIALGGGSGAAGRRAAAELLKTSGNFKAVTRALSTAPSLRTVSLRGLPIDHTIWQPLLDLLAANSAIDSLDLSGCSLSKHAAALSRFLEDLALRRRRNSLRRLALGSNGLKDDTIGAVALFVSQSPQLESLQLAYNHVSVTGFGMLLRVLPRCPNLVSINLSGNRRTMTKVASSKSGRRKDSGVYGDAYLKVLAQAFGGAQPPSIRDFSCDRCGVSDAGLQSLVDAYLSAPTTPALQALHLRENDISDAGIDALTQAMASRSTAVPLMDVQLAGNRRITHASGDSGGGVAVAQLRALLAENKKAARARQLAAESVPAEHVNGDAANSNTHIRPHADDGPASPTENTAASGEDSSPANMLRVAQDAAPPQPRSMEGTARGAVLQRLGRVGWRRHSLLNETMLQRARDAMSLSTGLGLRLWSTQAYVSADCGTTCSFCNCICGCNGRNGLDGRPGR